MGYSIDKRRGLDRLNKKLYLSNYHSWLEQQRLKDRKKLTEKSVTLANYYLAKGRCPYCKEKFTIQENADGIMSRVCETHGVLAIKRKEWRIWTDEKKYSKGEKI